MVAVVFSPVVRAFFAVVVFECVAVGGTGGIGEQHLQTQVFRQFFTRSAAVAGLQQFPRCI